MFKLTYQKKRPSPAYCLLRGLYAGLLISLCAYSQTSFATQLILAYDLQQISIENIEQKALSQSSPDDRKIDERSTGEKNTEKRETDEQKSNKRKTEEETGSQFNKHIQWLKQKKYSIWHLKDLLDWQAQGKTLPEKLAVIYFKQLNDEFFNHILPILKQQQIKASVNLNHQWISKDDSKNSSSSDTSDKKTGWSDLKQLNNLHWVNHIQPLSASNKNRSFSSKQLLTLRNELFLNQSIIDFHFGTQGHIASYPGNTLNHEIYQLTSSNHYQLIDLREGYLEPVITPQQV